MPKPRYGKFLWLAEAALALGIGIKLVFRFPQSFNFDDWLQFFSYTPQLIPHDYVLNHFLARVFSYGSISTFGSLFGRVPWAAQLPSLLLSLIFIFYVWHNLKTLLPAPYRLIIFLNLFSNEFFQWAFLSTRGYLQMLFLTTVAQFLILKFIRCPRPKQLRPTLKWLLFLMLLSPLTYFFTTLHLGLLVISFFLWCRRSPAVGKENFYSAFRPYRYLALFCFLLTMVWTAGQIRKLIHADFVFSTANTILWSKALLEWTQVAGTFWVGWPVAFLLFIVAIGVAAKSCHSVGEKTRWLPLHDSVAGWCAIHLLLALSFFGLSAIFLETQQLHVRFLLPLLWPLLFLAIDGTTKLPPRLQPWATLGMLTFFVLAPALDGFEIRKSQLGPWSSVGKFSQMLSRKLASQDVPCTEVSCVPELDHVGFCLELFPQLPKLGRVATNNRPSASTRRPHWRIEMNRNPVFSPSVTRRNEKVVGQIDDWLTLYRSDESQTEFGQFDVKSLTPFVL